jgi:hypothetical protein
MSDTTPFEFPTQQPTMPPPPRSVRFSRGIGAKGWLARFFVLPSLAISFLFASFLILILFTLFFGPITEATITSVRTANSFQEREAFFTYEADGQTHKGSSWLEPPEADQVSIALAQYRHVTKPVRHLEFGGFDEAIFAGTVPIAQPVGCFLFALVFFMIGATLINVGWLSRRRALRLSRFGAATEGSIVGRDVAAPVRWIKFHRVILQFAPDGQSVRQAIVHVASAAAQKLKIGDRVTVFYDPRNPSSCVIHEAAPVQVAH